MVNDPGGGPEQLQHAFLDRDHASAFAASLNSDTSQSPPAVVEAVLHDRRRRCRLCGEPIVLDDPTDVESWRHADDAHDLGDHTAE